VSFAAITLCVASQQVFIIVVAAVVYLVINSAWKLTAVIIKEYHCLPTTHKILFSILVSRLTTETKLLGIISVDFAITNELLIRHSAFIRYWGKNGSIMGQYISCL
jgi:hypothetical protein